MIQNGMELEDEIWKEIPRLPSYEVSNMGRVRRVDRGRRTSPGRIRKIRISECGYPQINVYRKNERIHRLVLETFVGPCPTGLCSNHKNGIKTDNRLENLEWITNIENVRHAEKKGLTTHPVGEKSYRSKLKNGEVYLIKKLLSENKFAHRFIGKMFRVTKENICSIKYGNTWTSVTYP